MLPSTLPYDWVRRLEPALLQLDDIPLLGAPPPFPWEAFAKYLNQLFEDSSFTISPGEFLWRSQEQLVSDLEEPLIYTHINFPSFEGTVIWAFPETDVPHLMALLLEPSGALSAQDIAKDYQEGFYRFLTVEILNAFGEVGFDKALLPHLLPEQAPPSFNALCLDISFSIQTHVFTGRLILTEAFRHSWKQRYAAKTLLRPEVRPDIEKRARELTVTLQLEGGRTSFSIRQWKKIKTGDFLLLDQCSLSTSGTSRVLVNYRESPIFIGELLDGKVKLTQAHEYHEVKVTMKEEEHDEDKDFEEEMTDEEFDFSLDEEDFETEESEDEESEEDSELEEDEEEDSEVEESEIEESEIEDSTPGALKQEEEATSSSPKKRLGSPSGKIEDIPVSLIVELGRIEITIEKLLQLQAGNLLELDVHPEDHVDLVMNGRCVGKGELHRIGDVLGVRVTEVG